MADFPSDQHTVFVRPPIAALLAAVIIGGGFYLGGKFVETRTKEPTLISVTGEGKAFMAPDIAEISLGAQTGRQASAKVAMEQLKAKMDAVFKAVKDAGVEEKDIRTEQFSLNPVYDWSNGKQTMLGFEAMQSLRVKVRDLDKASGVLEAATAAGANQAGNVSFTIDDPETKRSEARQAAIEQAREKAQKLASDLGMSLGKIRGFQEGGGYTPPLPMRAMMGGADMAMEKVAMPLPAGEQEIQAQVSITYELK